MTMLPIECAQAGAQAGRSTWWLSYRSTTSIARYRAVVGIGLALHFGRHALELAPWFSGFSLAEARGGDYGLPDYAIALGFGFGALLGVLTALGYSGRISAFVLYALSVLTYRTLQPIAVLDDYFAVIASLALVLLPTTRASRNPATGNADSSTGAMSATVLLLFVVALYMAGGTDMLRGASSLATPLVLLAFRCVAVALVIPILAVQRFGVVLQLCLHGYLLVTTSATLTHLSLAATALFFWGELPRESARFRIDAGTVGGVTCLLIALLGYAEASLLRGHGNPGSRLLSDLGLLPVHVALAEQSRVHLEVADGSGDAANDWLRRDARAHVAASRLAAMNPEQTTARHVARFIAARYCHESKHFGRIGRLWQGTSDGAPIMEFACGAQGGAARVVMAVKDV